MTTGANAADSMRKGTRVMTSSKRWTIARTVALGLAAGMILTISGDRGGWAAPPPGIDPLDILNLQIRANAIVILDSSGSMMETLASNAGDLGADDTHAKMYQAKAVLTQVIRENERKVSFQFGQYEQPGVGAQPGAMSVPTDEGASYNPPGDALGGAMRSSERFLYVSTTTTAAPATPPPSMATNNLTVDLRSYVVPNNARLHLIEAGNNRNAVVPAGRYATGNDLAAALATAATNAGAGGNTYVVTYMDNHRFRFTRDSGSQSFTLRWSAMNSGGDLALRTEIGGSTTDQAATGTPLSATTANNSGGDIDLRRLRNITGEGQENRFTEGAITYYKLYARRFFNGQRLVLRQSSTNTNTAPTAAPASLTLGDIVCSVTPALGTTGVGGTGQLADPLDPLSARDQPWVELVRGDANCNPVTGGNAQVARFTFSSVPRANNALRPAAGQQEYIPGGGEWRRLNTTPNPDEWVVWGTNNTCGGFESLVSLQPCTNNSQFNLVAPFLKLEVEIDPVTRQPIGYSEDTDGLITPAVEPTVQGIRAGGNTPIAEAIADVDSVFTTNLWPVISAYGGGNGPFPKTFLIFLTDGDDTCETPDGGNNLSADELALRAAHRAQLLYQSIDTSNAARTVASSITTFVIAFGGGASADRSNWIAWGGSGMVRPTFNEGGSIGLRWANIPTQADRDACTTCRDAFVAQNASALSDALRIAIDQGQTVGVFSDQQSVTETIFELAYLAPQPVDPDDAVGPLSPSNRYNLTLPVLLQSTFDMPDFSGHLKAFRRGGVSTVEQWDAAVKLNARLTAGMAATQWSFDELRGGGATTDVSIGTSTAKIKRRVYSSPRNGVFDIDVNDVLATPPVNPGRVTIWPPEPTVDPVPVTGTYPAGILDDAMGIGTGSTPLLDFAALQLQFAACTASVPANLPADCTAASGRARKEARQIILASMAGADVVTLGGLAVRRASDKALMYRQKAWSLGESTLAAPAVASPPSAALPDKHQAEYRLFIDGPRDATTGVAINATAKGFGMRNPDDDGTTAGAGADTRMDLKPVMSVVYHAANDMLHAFRAGPCRNASGASTCQDGSNETGGEELWGYVPYDVLHALKDRRVGQKRDPHTYMLASPVRLADIFLAGQFNDTNLQVSGTGVWRTMIFFGRGIGGKYVTALDVTFPGPFTKGSLQTSGPIVVWSRGNPDTQNGRVGGPANNTVGGNNDLTLYADMGQTWSVPAIGNVVPENNTTLRKLNSAVDPIEFVAYMGSGFDVSTACLTGVGPCQGQRFYALDALTGDVIGSVNVGNRPGTNNPFPNALVAGPAAFNAARLSNVDEDINVALDITDRVYFNDIHGRVHRLLTDAPNASIVFGDLNDTASTVLHPLGTAPSLINSGNFVGDPKPHIYVESGHDNRLFPPDAANPTTPPFKLVGMMDEDNLTDPSSTDGVAGPARVLFSKPLPGNFRGSTQPTTVFAGNGFARVFFAVTRFNPAGTLTAPPPPPCRSSFDSQVFALAGNTGNAAFDLNASGQDEFVQYTGEKVQAIQVVRGRLILDRALGAEIAPEPPPPSTIAGTPDDQSVFQGLSIPAEFTVTNRAPFKSGTSVCR
jgi:hypothetical protein